MTAKTTLPESLTIKFEFTITLEEMEEYLGYEEITLQNMLDELRAQAHELDYNDVECANVYDQNGDLVC